VFWWRLLSHLQKEGLAALPGHQLRLNRRVRVHVRNEGFCARVVRQSRLARHVSRWLLTLHLDTFCGFGLMPRVLLSYLIRLILALGTDKRRFRALFATHTVHGELGFVLVLT